MVCYYCQRGGDEVGASQDCPQCGRWICAFHEGRYGSCTGCERNDEKRRLQSEAEEQAKKLAARWCDFCGTTVPSAYGWSSVRKCVKCSRQFCTRHGQTVWEEDGRFGAIWVRCIHHLAFPHVLGDRMRGFNLDDVIGVLSLPFAYVGLAGVFLLLFTKKPDYYRRRGDGEPWRTYRCRGFNCFGESVGDEWAYEFDK
jgi:hypothetical protein